jgi:hypothetical protein
VRGANELLRAAKKRAAADGGCRPTPRAAGHVPLAPGPAAGILVATHFVYSMALKRKRAFRAFGWDLSDARNRSEEDGSSCFGRDKDGRAMLFGHTFFDQVRARPRRISSHLVSSHPIAPHTLPWRPIPSHPIPSPLVSHCLPRADGQNQVGPLRHAPRQGRERTGVLVLRRSAQHGRHAHARIPLRVDRRIRLQQPRTL